VQQSRFLPFTTSKPLISRKNTNRKVAALARDHNATAQGLITSGASFTYMRQPNYGHLSDSGDHGVPAV